VDELAAMRPLVKGAGSLERFDYWLESLRYMKTMGELGCLLGQQRQALTALRDAPTSVERRTKAEAALDVLREMVPVIERIHGHLYATVTTRGAMGTVANWQQHVLPRVFEQPSREIAQALGRPLPDDARLGRAYTGPERLIVPTVRTLLEPGEPLRLEAIVLGAAPARSVRLAWRPMGSSGAWATVLFEHDSRGVWRLTLPSPGADLEYVVEAASSAGTALRVPAAGRDVPRTVVVSPASGRR
jgi:hypothetical protein